MPPRKILLLATCIALLAVLCLPMPAATQTLGKITEIEIRTDGSARWVVENKFPLDTPDNEIPQTTTLFETVMKEKIDNAAVLANRAMEMRNFTVYGPVQLQEYKRVRYEFEWTNFAKLEETRIRIGDVFEAGFLDLPSNVDALTILYPADYRASGVTPTPKETIERGYKWYGPQSFGNGEPGLTLTPTPSLWPKIALAVVILGGLVAGWFLWFKKLFRPMVKAAEKPKAPPVEEILKSDAERAIEILKGAGGRMHQTELVKRLDFSKSKVSALLSSMEQAGTIKRTRMGRKNLITLKLDREAQPRE